MYTDKVLECFKKTEHAQEMENADAVGEVGNVKCGDIMRVYLKINDNKITNISYLTYGCVAAIASTEALCKIVKGKTLDEAKEINHKDVIAELDKLPTVKIHCSSLSIEALGKAIENYTSS
tara:strand:- start:119 stop:481 length:363 start_codon:yes stop_codon:yes gene_type:complete